jgi:hypothetical protein
MIILQCWSRGVCVTCHVCASHDSHWSHMGHARRRHRLIHRALYILGTRATFAVSLNYTIYGIIWCPCWGKTIHQRVNISYTGSLSRSLCAVCTFPLGCVCNGWASYTCCVYLLLITFSNVSHIDDQTIYPCTVKQNLSILRLRYPVNLALIQVFVECWLLSCRYRLVPQEFDANFPPWTWNLLISTKNCQIVKMKKLPFSLVESSCKNKFTKWYLDFITIISLLWGVAMISLPWLPSGVFVVSWLFIEKEGKRVNPFWVNICGLFGSSRACAKRHSHCLINVIRSVHF